MVQTSTGRTSAGIGPKVGPVIACQSLTKDIKRVAYYEKPSEKRRRRSRKGPKPRPTGR